MVYSVAKVRSARRCEHIELLGAGACAPSAPDKNLDTGEEVVGRCVQRGCCSEE